LYPKPIKTFEKELYLTEVC